MPPPAAIVDATPQQAEAIRGLMARVIEHDVTQAPDLLAETLANVNANVDLWLQQPQRCAHLVAAQEGQVVGVVMVKDFWNLCSLFVASECQGQGLGRALLEAAADRCRGRSDKGAIHLNAATRAVPFYRKLGFVEREASRPLPAGFLAMRRAL